MSSNESPATIPPAPKKGRYRVSFHDRVSNLSKRVVLSHEGDAKAFFLRLAAIHSVDFAELVRFDGPRVEVLAQHFSEDGPEGGRR